MYSSSDYTLYLIPDARAHREHSEVVDYNDAIGHKALVSEMDILDILQCLVPIVSPLQLLGSVFIVAMDTNSEIEARPSNTPHQHTRDCSAEQPKLNKAKIPALDVFNTRTQPSLEFYSKNRGSRNKIPYMEFGIDDVVVLSNEDKEEIKMYNLVHGVPNMLNMMKK